MRFIFRCQNTILVFVTVMPQSLFSDCYQRHSIKLFNSCNAKITKYTYLDLSHFKLKIATHSHFKCANSQKQSFTSQLDKIHNSVLIGKK